MRIRNLKLLAGPGLLVIAAAAGAQSAAPGDTSAEATQWGLEEVVVTARRRSESLQDVPQTVDAVTADDIEKLNLQQFTDVQALVPGLTMSSGGDGYSTSATIRGASFQVTSSASPTVEFYLNDGPIQSIFLFQSMFDVGQIEVLRGPQGTLRGRASPSGSMTVTTHQPDVAEFGGYLSVLGTDEDSTQAQGAINIPLIRDSLALRVAGVYDESDYDHVRSINNDSDPSQKTKGGRATLRWEAGDAFTASVMYQYMERDLHTFGAYESLHLSEPTAPVVNTAALPEIRASDRLGITDGAGQSTQEMDIVTAQFDWRFGGQKLSYVGTYSKLDVLARAPQDLGNVARPGLGTVQEFYQNQHSWAQSKAHELRLASEERLFGFMDYTVGGFYQDFSSPTDLINRTLLGAPVAPYTLFSAGTFDTQIARRSTTEEMSVFANLTFHVGDNTELSAGARYIDYQTDSSLRVQPPSPAPVLTQTTSADEKPTIWNVAASHRFSEDFMLYANIGTSWRDGPQAVGIFRPMTPLLEQFTNLKSEDSTSYELGFKADFLDNRLRVNLSAFHQDFENFIYRGAPVWFVDITGVTPTGPAFGPAQFNLLASVDAKVDGAELDVAFQATERLNLGLTFAYAKGEMQDGVIPCNDFAPTDGRPDVKPPTPTIAQLQAAVGPGEAVSACTVGDRLSFAPDWSATLQAEYTFPVSASLDVFGRGLYSYYTDNVQDPYNTYDDVDAYGLLNLYAGLRSNDGAWEVTLFARNALNTEEVLNRSSGAIATPYRGAAGGAALASPYVSATFTPVQEFGLSLRYAFGSR